MKKIFISVLAIPMLLAGCGKTSNPPHVFSQGGPPPTAVLEHTVNTKVVWTIQDVEAGANGHDRWYNITLEKVDKVGKKYEVIQGGTSQGPGGVFSNVLSPGTLLYEIPGIDPTQALAVQWKGQYIKATRINK